MDQFPESCLSGMVVCKQYFEEAAIVFMKTKTFIFDSCSDLEDFVIHGNAVQKHIVHSSLP